MNLSQEDIRKPSSPSSLQFKSTDRHLITDVYACLPTAELEHIQRAIGVFCCLHSYLSVYVFYREAAVTSGPISRPAIPEVSPRNAVSTPDLAHIPDFASFGNIPDPGKVIVAVGDSIKMCTFI